MEAKIKTSTEAMELIHRFGFMLLSRNPWDYPSIEEATEPEAWHTGDELDPWLWKDRLAAEKQAAYTRVLGRRPGFIAPEWYPAFLAAYQPKDSVEGRYRSGLLSNLEYRLYACLRDRGPLNTHDLKGVLGVGKEDKREFENALVGLQGTMEVTVAGAERRINRSGEYYGWLVSQYCTVEQWAEPEWLSKARELDRDEAVGEIRIRVMELCPDLTAKEVARMLCLPDCR